MLKIAVFQYITDLHYFVLILNNLLIFINKPLKITNKINQTGLQTPNYLLLQTNYF